MRKTNGFLNQAAGLEVQVAAMTEEAVRKPGSSSKQQVEVTFENRENPKRTKRSDDEYKNPTIHSLDTTTKQTKSNTAPPGEYTKPVTMTISPGNTPASGGEDETLLTASETRLRHWMRYPWSRSKEQGKTPTSLQNQSQQPPPKETIWARHRSRQLKRRLTNPKPRLDRQTRCGKATATERGTRYPIVQRQGLVPNNK